MRLCLEWKDFFNVVGVDCGLKLMIKLFYRFCGPVIKVIGRFNDLFPYFVFWKSKCPPDYHVYMEKGNKFQIGWLTMLVTLNIRDFDCQQNFHGLLHIFLELENFDFKILDFNNWEWYPWFGFQSLGRGDYYICLDGCGRAWYREIFLMWLP